MASTSSSATRLNHTPNIIRYDVFLSFRGEDTRNNFTDHLYHALTGAGLRTFRDNDEIDRGQELKPEIENAIIASRASIVVLSKNYANSIWCMDELCLILEQRRNCGHFVLPLFYHVNPSDVRNQSGSFVIKRSKRTTLLEVAHLTRFSEKMSKWTKFNVRRWKEALTDVANLTGLNLSSSRSETDFIEEVVETMKQKLPVHLIGMEAQVNVINSWLKTGHTSVITICGVGGSGKTTIAQHIYNSNKHDFQSHIFIQEIRKQPDGLLGLQKQFLRYVLGETQSISSVSVGTQMIEKVLRRKKMLIVLDDIDQHGQLSALLGRKEFPTESKIIITTRNQNINSWLDTICWRSCVQKFKFLNHRESIELLSWHAFRSKIPMKEFKELVVQLAQHCEGNPRALKVLGSSLFVSDEDPMTIKNMIGIWRSKMKSLISSNENTDCKIEDVL